MTNWVAGAWKSEFVYDAQKRIRISREYCWQSGWVRTNETRFVYLGMDVLQERDTNNAALVTYTRAGSMLLARTDSTLNPQLSTTFYHCDGNLNVTAMINTNQLVVAQYRYDPYGNMVAMSGPLSEANAYRNSSKRFINNAGIYYFGFRFYEPNLQRWLNADPISEAGGINLYCYAANNPANLYDPFGLEVPPLGDDGLSMRYLIDSIRQLSKQLDDVPTGSPEWKNAYQTRVRLYRELAEKQRLARLEYEAARAREYAQAAKKATRASRYCRVAARGGAVVGAGAVGAFTGYNTRNEVNNGFETIGALFWDVWYGNPYGTSVPSQPEPAMTVYFDWYYRK